MIDSISFLVVYHVTHLLCTSLCCYESHAKLKEVFCFHSMLTPHTGLITICRGILKLWILLAFSDIDMLLPMA